MVLKYLLEAPGKVSFVVGRLTVPQLAEMGMLRHRP